jgi:hypothetical protein
MQPCLRAPHATPPVGAAAVQPLLALLEDLQLPPTAGDRLFLRFERARFAEGRAGVPPGARVALLVSWRSRSLHSGDVDCLLGLDAARSEALRQACASAGMRYIDNT